MIIINIMILIEENKLRELISNFDVNVFVSFNGKLVSISSSARVKIEG